MPRVSDERRATRVERRYRATNTLDCNAAPPSDSSVRPVCRRWGIMLSVSTPRKRSRPKNVRRALFGISRARARAHDTLRWQRNSRSTRDLSPLLPRALARYLEVYSIKMYTSRDLRDETRRFEEDCRITRAGVKPRVRENRLYICKERGVKEFLGFRLARRSPKLFYLVSDESNNCILLHGGTRTLAGQRALFNRAL